MADLEGGADVVERAAEEGSGDEATGETSDGVASPLRHTATEPERRTPE